MEVSVVEVEDELSSGRPVAWVPLPLEDEVLSVEDDGRLGGVGLLVGAEATEETLMS